MTATDAGPVGPAALLAGAVAAATTPAALLDAGAAELVAACAAAAALVAAGAAALDGAVLLEADDFLLAQPATKSAAIPRKTVALIAGDVVRIAFFIPRLPHMCDYLVLTLMLSTTALGGVPFNAVGRRSAGVAG